MQFLFVTPQTRAGIDTPNGTAITITGVMTQGPIFIDDINLKATANFVAIEDAANGPLVSRSHPLTVSITPSMTYAQTQAAFKAAVSAALNNVPLQ